jgi:hypothetical protein
MIPDGSHGTPLSRCILGLLLPVLLGGCLVSKTPLIEVDNASYPLKDGTVLEEYIFTDGKFTPVLDKSGKIKRGKLEIKAGRVTAHPCASV